MRWISALGLALALGCGGGDGVAAADAEPQACEGGTGCGEPCATGNSFGVGRFCTPGGGECSQNPDGLAPFCTVDFSADAPPFCTRPCAAGDDLAMCGEDAMCIDQGGQLGCVPVACL